MTTLGSEFANFMEKADAENASQIGHPLRDHLLEIMVDGKKCFGRLSWQEDVEIFNDNGSLTIIKGGVYEAIISPDCLCETCHPEFDMDSAPEYEESYFYDDEEGWQQKVAEWQLQEKEFWTTQKVARTRREKNDEIRDNS
jgi:hypothetical protein